MCGRSTNELTLSELHALYKLSDEICPLQHTAALQHRADARCGFVHLDKAGNIEPRPLVAGAILRQGTIQGRDVQCTDQGDRHQRNIQRGLQIP
jgi:hypothetical protein